MDEVEEIRLILMTDPYNTSMAHNIRKLKAVSVGEGQWRLRFGDYRIRYDFNGDEVILYSFRRRPKAY